MSSGISASPPYSKSFYNEHLKQPLFFVLGILILLSSVVAAQYLSENVWKGKKHFTLLVMGAGALLAGLCFYYAYCCSVLKVEEDKKLSPSENASKKEGASVKKALPKGGNTQEWRIAIFQETLQLSKACGYIYDGLNILLETARMLAKSHIYRENEVIPVGHLAGKFKTEFSVTTEDTFEAAIALAEQGVSNIAVENMANAFNPGGGVRKGCTAQEESLCRRSTHILALDKLSAEGKYPLPEFGGAYCPHVQIFRKSEREQCGFLPKIYEVAVIAVAAYDLRPDGDRKALGIQNNADEKSIAQNKLYVDGTKNKIRNKLRKLAMEGHTNIVLGASGCGAFVNPKQTVGNLFKEVFQEPEFKGVFERVCFGILEIFQGDDVNVRVFRDLCASLNV